MAEDPYKKGVKKAEEILGPEGLQRLGDDKDIQEGLSMKKGDVSRQRGMTSRFERMAEEGMSPAAREAMRTKMARQMSQAEQMAGFRMGGALGGARGASAAAQQRSLVAQGMMGRANIQRDIFLQNEQAKAQGLQGMAQSLAQERAATGAYTSALGEVKTFDIGQAAAEKELKASIGMQYEQMASAERAAEKGAQAQIAAANAQSSGKK